MAKRAGVVKRAPGKMSMAKFEKSKFNKEPRGAKEGSAREEALDRSQLAKLNKGK